MNDLDPGRLTRLLSQSVPDLPQPPDRLAGVARRSRRRRTMRGAAAIGAGAVVTAAILTVPTLLNNDESAPPVAANVLASAPVCQRPDLKIPEGHMPKRVPLPKEFTPIAVVRCEEKPKDTPQGATTVTIEQRADTGFDSFVAELRKPSAPHGKVSCTLELRLVPDFFLIGKDGTAIRPEVPTDTCAKPTGAALTALEALPWKTVSQVPQ